MLQALDDAADAFAALPPGPSSFDSEEFERGIGELRRIVLARPVNHDRNETT